MTLERYELAQTLRDQPSEASVRQLIPMLGEKEPVMIDEGMSVYDVEPTYGYVSAIARGALVKMMPIAMPILIEALASSTVEITRELLSVLDELPVERRVTLSDEAHATMETAAQKLRPIDAEGARFERELARRVRANELATAEALWRAWLAHPTRAYRALYELPDLVENKAALARELTAWALEHPEQGHYALGSALERLPGLLPPETVRLLAASQLPRKDDSLLPILAAYGEPAAALIPHCLELLRNEPLAEDERWPSRHVRWRYATKALVRLADALDPRTIEVMEPMLVEMGEEGSHYGECGAEIRAALRQSLERPAEVPIDVVEPERGFLLSLRFAESLDMRAVYADWLEEQGRPEHAAIVRTTMQIRLLLDGERLPGVPSIDTLRDTIQQRCRLSPTPVWWQRIIVPSTHSKVA